MQLTIYSSALSLESAISTTRDFFQASNDEQYKRMGKPFRSLHAYIS